MSYSLPIIIIIAICLIKLLLELFSVVKTEVFIKLFFMDFKMDTSSFNVKTFKLFDIVWCLGLIILLYVYKITSNYVWLIVALLLSLAMIILFYRLKQKSRR